jgi:hypothetical protein
VGLEVEGVKKLTKNLEIRANVTAIKSETNVVMKSRKDVNGVIVLTPYDTLVRPMYGQAPFIINAIVNYNFEKSRVNVTLSYNIQGKRLVIAATENVPDVYEMPRNVIDLKFQSSWETL